MNRRLALIFATVALLALPGSVAAHTAVTTCGGTIELAKGSATVDIIRTDVDPDVLVYDDAPGNGTLAVEPGVFKAVWSDGYTLRGLVVTACTQPTPTPTPSPTPTPTPTASPTPSPTPTPEPTPCPYPHTPPEPCITPVPEPTQPCEAGPPAFDCGPFDTPRPTLPPTSTEAAAGPPSGLTIVVLSLAFVAGGAWVLGRTRP